MLYQWKCNVCGEEIEVNRRMKDYDQGPEETCKCGSDKFTKLISKSNFVLKGDDWHKSDYNKFERRVDKK